MEWDKELSGVYRTRGFMIEPTGNSQEPYALFKADLLTNRPSHVATFAGSLDECQRMAESISEDPSQAYQEEKEE